MKLSDAEWQLMNALWEKYPATAREIAERLPEGVTWAYTTIKTMLGRLVEKKALGETKKGKTSVYEPLLSRSRARRSALSSLVNHAFDGAFGPLMHFMLEEEQLTDEQRAELRQLLKETADERR
jgi:BlaI family penicillinase repressor